MAEDIVTWFNEQSAWMREAAETYIKKGAIEDSKIKELADICVSEVKGEDCSKYKVSATNLLSIDSGGSLAIKQISKVKGVNAIDTDKPMNFAVEGMNVIYGANGSGKSGYIRVLKMVSGATYREEIKPNIYKTQKTNPKCVITVVDEKMTEKDIYCNLQVPGEHDILKKIDIFDTKAAQGYVSEEKEAAFEPWIFGLFSALGEAANKVKTELAARRDQIQINAYDIPQSFANADKVKALENITFKSKTEDFIEDFTENDEALLKELKGKSQIEKNELIIKIKNEQISSLTEIVNYFSQFEIFYTASNFKIIEDLAEDWKSKADAYKLSQELLNKNIDDVDKKNLENLAWKKLWTYARVLYGSSNETDLSFGDKGSVCPLCHQVITEKESERIKTIDEYINGMAASLEQQAKNKYKLAISHLQTKSSEEIIAKLGDFEPDFKDIIVEVNNVLINNKKSVDQLDNTSILLEFAEINKAKDPISKKISDLKNDVENLRKLNNVEDQKKIVEEIEALELKRLIKSIEHKVEDNIQKMKEQHLYGEAIKKTATNKLTSKSKELAKELITDAYIDRFNEEIKKLSASGLTAQIVQRGGRAGKNPYKVQLCDAEGDLISPKDILSEGESRAVALAAFFAEATGRTENCPLIIDDPISSLDYEYESRVISRLVEASLKRQVIVFTHRISVVVGISERITDKIKFHEISLKATKERKGIPGDPDVNASKSDKVLQRLIGENLSKLKKMDELCDEYSREKHYICQQFRNCVEKSVEEYLLGELVMRFRRDVQTKRIKYLRTITKEDCDIVDAMMTKYSAYDHSMSSETPLIEFDVSEIETDMDIFLKWILKRKALVK